MYHMRQRMVPSFFPLALVEQVFRCGKSVHFIRDSLQDANWVVRGADESILAHCSLSEVSALRPCSP